MSQSTPASVNVCLYPYALSDDAHTRLSQLRALLNILSQLSGTAAFHERHGTPEFNNDDLHYALWGLGDLLGEAMDSMVDRPFGQGEQA